MMKQKQRDLVNLLIAAKGVFKTSEELANELSLSDRTIRNYIKELKLTMEANGANIIAKQGLGYQLKILDRQQFDLFLADCHLTGLDDLNQSINEVADRKRYLLNLMLLEDQKIDPDELSERLFISTSQLIKDISEIKQQILSYDLAVKKDKQGFYIEGKERAKRHFMMNYFFTKDAMNILQPVTVQAGLSEAIGFDLLTIIILDECREAHLKLSDFIIQNLVLHLSLSIKRIQAGLDIQNLGLEDSIATRIEYEVAGRIIERIEAIIPIHFPLEERAYLTLHLMAKSNHTPLDEDIDLVHSLKELLVKMQIETEYSFATDNQLFNGLIEHIKPMIVRLERHISQENPLLNEIKTNYTETFNLTKYYMCQLPALASYEVSEDEWAYITLHFLAAIEKMKHDQKARVLIICATGYGSAQLLKTRAEKEFGERINIVDVKGYYEIDKHVLEQVDFVVSSIDLSAMIFKVPVFHVSVFLPEKDVQMIRDYLNQQTQRKTIYSSKTAKQEDSSVVLTELSDMYFYRSKERITKEAVIDQLLTQLAVNEAADYSQQMHYQIAQRIKLGTILFSDAIAVPHPAVPVGRIEKVGVALLPEGVYWNEDYPDIKFVFMVSPSRYENYGLTVVTKAIVTLIERKATQEQLLQVQDFEKFKTIFMKLIEEV
ncbi:BglG family transcription antiterminator [Enterococcus bulliens]